jgi:hypothetical protein
MDEVDIYVVHVWHQPRFRASARLVAQETTQVFATAADLAQYLEAPPRPGPAEPAAPGQKDTP